MQHLRSQQLKSHEQNLCQKVFLSFQTSSIHRWLLTIWKDPRCLSPTFICLQIVNKIKVERKYKAFLDLAFKNCILFMIFICKHLRSVYFIGQNFSCLSVFVSLFQFFYLNTQKISLFPLLITELRTMDPNRPNKQNDKDERDQWAKRNANPTNNNNPNNNNSNNSQEDQNTINSILNQAQGNPISTNFGTVNHVQLTNAQSQQLLNLGFFNNANFSYMTISSTGTGNIQPLGFGLGPQQGSNQPSMPTSMQMPMPIPISQPTNFTQNPPQADPNLGPKTQQVTPSEDQKKKDQKPGKRGLAQMGRTKTLRPVNEKQQKQKQQAKKAEESSSPDQEEWLEYNRKMNKVTFKKRQKQSEQEPKNEQPKKGQEKQQKKEKEGEEEVSQQFCKMQLESNKSNKSDEKKPEKPSEQKQE